MKVLLHLTAALLFVQNVSPAAIRTKKETPAEILQIANALRQKVGEATHINYPELKWDSNLESKIGSLPNKCDDIKPGSDYRFMVGDGDNNGRAIIAFNIIGLIILAADGVPGITQEMREKAENEIENETAFFFELLHPKQTKIACVERTCTGSIPPDVIGRYPELAKYFEGNTYKMTEICLLGPSNSLRDLNSETKKKAMGDVLQLSDNKSRINVTHIAEKRTGNQQQQPQEQQHQKQEQQIIESTTNGSICGINLPLFFAIVILLL